MLGLVSVQNPGMITLTYACVVPSLVWNGFIAFQPQPSPLLYVPSAFFHGSTWKAGINPVSPGTSVVVIGRIRPRFL